MPSQRGLWAYARPDSGRRGWPGRGGRRDADLVGAAGVLRAAGSARPARKGRRRLVAAAAALAILAPAGWLWTADSPRLVDANLSSAGDTVKLDDGLMEETGFLLRRSPGQFAITVRNEGRWPVTLLGADNSGYVDENLAPRYELTFSSTFRDGDAPQRETATAPLVELQPGDEAWVRVSVTTGRCARRDGGPLDDELEEDEAGGISTAAGRWPTLPLRVRHLGVTSRYDYAWRVPLVTAVTSQPGLSTLCAGVPEARPR